MQHIVYDPFASYTVGEFLPLPVPGTFPCDGRSLHRNVYPELFKAIGTTFGSDGKNTFNLPDCRGRGEDYISAHDSGAHNSELPTPRKATAMEVILKVEDKESVDLSTVMPGACFIRHYRKKISEAAGIYMRLSEMDQVPCGPSTRRVSANVQMDHIRCVSLRSGDIYQFPSTEQVRPIKAKLYVFGEER